MYTICRAKMGGSRRECCLEYSLLGACMVKSMMGTCMNDLLKQSAAIRERNVHKVYKLKVVFRPSTKASLTASSYGPRA